jgi:two-component system response regulator HydG
MKSVLTISPSEEVTSLIHSALPSGYQGEGAASLKDGLKLHHQRPFDLVLSDLNLLRDGSSANNYTTVIRPFKEVNPLVKIVVLSSKEGIRETVNAVKSAADDYLTYPIHPAEARLVVESLSESLTQHLELDYLRDQFWKSEWLDVIHSQTVATKDVFKKIRMVAVTKATVLLTGENGTGKTLYARMLHRHSNRCDDPFICVHCGAIPDTLLESELFGHEKGAFTGAVRRKLGKFELTMSGTIFLDEIGTLTPSAQIKLLQVLQDGTYSRVGGEAVLKTEARVIAATNADLTEMSQKGEFRKDLYYRLNVFPVEIPPLRERLDDIPYFVEIFLKKLNQQYGKNIHNVHPQILEALKKHHWPGNIRELENLLERAYILETTTMLTPESFPEDLFRPLDQPLSLPNKAHLPLAAAPPGGRPSKILNNSISKNCSFATMGK